MRTVQLGPTVTSPRLSVVVARQSRQFVNDLWNPVFKRLWKGRNVPSHPPGNYLMESKRRKSSPLALAHHRKATPTGHSDCLLARLSSWKSSMRSVTKPYGV